MPSTGASTTIIEFYNDSLNKFQRGLVILNSHLIDKTLFFILTATESFEQASKLVN
jgi:hypothetical protein